MPADPFSRVAFILTDIVWRAMWAVLTLASAGALLLWLFLEIASLEWQGPDLTIGNPIIVTMALQQLWQMYSSTVLWAAIGLAVFAAVLWIALEACFRGGREHFWTFLGSGASRLAALTSTGILFGGLALTERSVWMTLLAAGVLLGVAFLAVLAETLIRRDAVELWGTDLFGVLSTIGASFLLQVLSLAILAAACAMMVLSASRMLEFVLAFGISILGAVLWSVFHSYLLAVRLSAIDIMRRDVRGV